MIRRIIEKSAPPGPGTDEGAVPRNVRLSKYPAEPKTWCLTARQSLFLRRQAPRPAPHFPDRAWGRGASLPSSPYFFIEEHHVLRLKMPTGPGDVVLHLPLSLIPSSASTTSSAPKCRAATGTWCLTALQPLFLRRGAPRPPLQHAGQPRGRGASSPAIPCFFVGKHHVRLPIFPTEPGDVVLHLPLSLIPSSASTTSSASKCRASPGAWCLTARQPLFLRRGAPRPPLQSAGHPRGRGASFPAMMCYPSIGQ